MESQIKIYLKLAGWCLSHRNLPWGRKVEVALDEAMINNDVRVWKYIALSLNKTKFPAALCLFAWYHYNLPQNKSWTD